MLRTRLIGALARYLAQPVKRYSPAADAGPLSLSVLHHGDVLLTEGNTRVAALVKRITQSTWSHVSIYVGPLEKGPDPLCIVEADIAAGDRPERRAEVKGFHVRGFGPPGREERDRFPPAGSGLSRSGGGYDRALAWAGALWLV